MTARWLLIGFMVAGCTGYGTGGVAEQGPAGPAGPAGARPTVATNSGLVGDGSDAAPLAVAFGGTGTTSLVCRSDHTHRASELASGVLGAGVFLPGNQVMGPVPNSDKV